MDSSWWEEYKQIQIQKENHNPHISHSKQKKTEPFNPKPELENSKERDQPLFIKKKKEINHNNYISNLLPMQTNIQPLSFYAQASKRNSKSQRRLMYSKKLMGMKESTTNVPGNVPFWREDPHWSVASYLFPLLFPWFSTFIFFSHSPIIYISPPPSPWTIFSFLFFIFYFIFILWLWRILEEMGKSD